MERFFRSGAETHLRWLEAEADLPLELERARAEARAHALGRRLKRTVVRIFCPPLTNQWGLWPHPPLIVDGRYMCVRQSGE